MDLWRRIREFFDRIPVSEALSAAAKEGDLGRVQALLARDRAHEQLDASHRGAALQLAAQYGHTAVAEVLLMAGGDSVIERGVIASAISKAAIGRHPGIIDLLAREYPEYFKGEHAAEGLRHAAEIGHSAVIRAFIGGGTPPDLRAPGHPTALLYAATRDAACVHVLLGAGANPNEVDANGRTALHRAAVAEEHASIHLLVAARADVCARDRDGLTAEDLSPNVSIRRFLRSKVNHPPLVAKKGKGDEKEEVTPPEGSALL